MFRFISSTLVVASTALSVYASPLSTSHDSSYRPSFPTFTRAPLLESHKHGFINDSYIVVLKEDVTPMLMTNHFNFLDKAHQSFADDFAGLQKVYNSHIKGYAGHFSDDVIEQVRSMPEVAYVERDQVVRTSDTQRGAPWGLARISHRKKLSFGTFTVYEYDTDGGEGVDVYVIDTGINVKHVEFDGRASWGKTIPKNDVDEDGNGHGTHCAGTIASNKFGVAKKANVVAVKVLGSNGSGSMSDVVDGVLWAAEQAAKKAAQAKKEVQIKGSTKHKGSVANMSLGGGKSDTLDRAVNAAVESGMHFAVAAGNENQDACNSSPARAQKAITVGASTMFDERAYFSNHGSCVDVFAPGLNILSTYIGSTMATATLSGTSMASPHVAGLTAYYLSLYPSKKFNPKVGSLVTPLDIIQHPFNTQSIYAVAHATLPQFITRFLPSPALIDAVVDDAAPVPKDPTLTPDQMKQALVDLSSKGILSDLPANTVNLLVFNNYTSSA